MLPICFVLVAVGLNLSSAVLLKLLTIYGPSAVWVIALGIGVAIVINAARLWVWAIIHRRYPLSHTYPMASLFFPAMLGIAYCFDEPITGRQFMGAVLVTMGVYWIATRREPL